MAQMFREMSALKKLDLSSFDMTNVTSVGRLIAFSQNIEELNLSSFSVSQVESVLSEEFINKNMTVYVKDEECMESALNLVNTLNVIAVY